MDTRDAWTTRPLHTLRDVTLATGEHHVWCVDLHAELALPDALSDEERARAGSIRHLRTRHEFVRARRALRALLGAYLGVDPDAPVLGALSHGKPTLVSPSSPLRFNVSHSGDWALIAFSVDPVGVDVEDRRRRADHALLTRHSFSELERARLPTSFDTDAARAAFFDVWSRKEAYIKALGLGLSLDLSSFSVSHDSPARVLRHAPGHPRLVLADVSPDANHSGALCAERIDSVETFALTTGG